MKYPSVACLRASIVIALCGMVWLRPGLPLSAQSGVTITSPANGAVLAAGPDYATDALSDPWDFSNRQDVTLDPAQIDGFSNFTISGGLAGGTLSTTRGGNSNGSNFYVLQRAYWGILNPGRTGRSAPIAPVYSKLSFKMSSTRGDQYPRVYWFHNDLGDPGGDAVGWKYVDQTAAAPAGNNIFVSDMTQANNGVPWTSGVVKGFGFYPNSTAVGYPVQFDWVRLTTGDGHPASKILPVTWSGGSGTATVVVRDAGGSALTVASGLSGTSFNWNYGILPPGIYTITVVRGGVSSAANSFRINTPPTLRVDDPDETGGDDFATTVLGNPWDMTDSGDFKYDGGATIVDHLIFRSATAGLFNGTSDGVTVGFAGSVPTGDPQLYVLSNGIASNTTAVIDTRRFHRLTFSLQVDRAFDLRLGSVARIFWGAATGGGAPYTDVSITKDIITWPGMNTYSVDLAPLTAAPDGGLEPGFPTGWTARNVRHLRLDPFEFAEQINFHYGAVKLAADDETKNGSFTIRFVGSEPDGDAVNVALYYDTDRDPSSGLALITSAVPLAAGQYVWNTTQVPQGLYYIYAVASDGRNATGRYSSGPVRVSSATGPSNPLMSVDAPAAGAVVTSAFEVAGWALDTAATAGTGIDAVQFYVFPNGGAGAGVFVGSATYGLTRNDVAAIYGSRFTFSGFHFTISGLGPGNYVLGVYGRSTVTNTFSAVRTVPITVNANALMSIDVPAPESTLTNRNFSIAGWAIDRAASSGIGVDAIHVYAYHNPGSGEAPVFLGVATRGIARSDVASLYGSRFTNSGYVLPVSWNGPGLGTGLYNIVVFAHSTATGTFNNLAVVQVRVQ